MPLVGPMTVRRHVTVLPILCCLQNCALLISRHGSLVRMSVFLSVCDRVPVWHTTVTLEHGAFLLVRM